MTGGLGVSLHGLLDQYGYRAVFVGILLESTGLPLPGESLMIAAAVYAATTGNMNIFFIVPLAALGAICGDQIKYGVGRWIGVALLQRWGRAYWTVGGAPGAGRFLFRRYGGWVVFLGRFAGFLRTFAAVLAGANRMAWHSFLLWNALGGIGWTALYGFGAYGQGEGVQRLSGPVGIGLGIVGGLALLAAVVFVKRNEKRLLEEARREMEREG